MLGTGRVMSQISMQALLRPRANSTSAGEFYRLGQRASNCRCGIDDLVQLSLGNHGDFRFGGHAQRKMAAAVGNFDRFRDCHVGALVFIGPGSLA